MSPPCAPVDHSRDPSFGDAAARSRDTEALEPGGQMKPGSLAV